MILSRGCRPFSPTYFKPCNVDSVQYSLTFGYCIHKIVSVRQKKMKRRQKRKRKKEDRKRKKEKHHVQKGVLRGLFPLLLLLLLLHVPVGNLLLASLGKSVAPPSSIHSEISHSYHFLLIATIVIVIFTFHDYLVLYAFAHQKVLSLDLRNLYWYTLLYSFYDKFMHL